MLNIDIEVHTRTRKKIMTEYVIPLPGWPDDDRIDAKGFGFLLNRVIQRMEADGIDTSIDNAYYVTVGEQELIFTTEKEKVK